MKNEHLPQQRINDEVTSQPQRPSTLLFNLLPTLQLGYSGLSPLMNPIPSIFSTFLAELEGCFYPALQSPLGLDGSPLTAHLPIHHSELLVLFVGLGDGHGELVGVHLPAGQHFAICHIVIDSLLREVSHYS